MTKHETQCNSTVPPPAPCHQREAPTGIEPQALYPKGELCRRLGWSLSSYNSARGKGLPVAYVGKRAFIFGEDAIEWVRKNAASSKTRKALSSQAAPKQELVNSED